MNDPHVVALNYVIRHSDSFDYSKAEPLYRDEVGEKRGCVGSERLGWLHGARRPRRRPRRRGLP